MPVIGFLHTASPEQNVKRLAAFRKGLSDTGFVEGQNLTIEYRWAAAANKIAAGISRRSCTQTGEIDRDARQHASGRRCQGGNLEYSDRIRSGRRSSGTRSRREHQPTGR